MAADYRGRVDASVRIWMVCSRYLLGSRHAPPEPLQMIVVWGGGEVVGALGS